MSEEHKFVIIIIIITNYNDVQNYKTKTEVVINQNYSLNKSNWYQYQCKIESYDVPWVFLKNCMESKNSKTSGNPHKKLGGSEWGSLKM